jgi:hypothetical protein
MLRSLFVVAAACCAHSAVAFSTAAPMALGTRNRAVAHGLARKQFRPARMPALRMVDEPKQVIDFGKVGFSDAENQVCTPARPRQRLCASAARSPSGRFYRRRHRGITLCCLLSGFAPAAWDTQGHRCWGLVLVFSVCVSLTCCVLGDDVLDVESRR